MTESRATLTERVLLAIRDAVEIGGLSHEEAAQITATVAADYARVALGESFLAELAALVRDRATRFPRGPDAPDLFEEPPAL